MITASVMKGSNLESEDKKRYKDKSTLSNGELWPHSNLSISLLLICL